MTEITTTDQTPRRAAFGLRRAATLSAIFAFGFLAPVAAGASPASPGETPPAPTGPGDLTAEEPCNPDLGCEPGPDDECSPLLATCDLAPGGDGPDEEECPPFLATCDLAPGGDGPDDPGGEPPDEVEPGADPQDIPTAQVDAPVRATPNYTG